MKNQNYGQSLFNKIRAEFGIKIGIIGPTPIPGRQELVSYFQEWWFWSLTKFINPVLSLIQKKNKKSNIAILSMRSICSLVDNNRKPWHRVSIVECSSLVVDSRITIARIIVARDADPQPHAYIVVNHRCYSPNFTATHHHQLSSRLCCTPVILFCCYSY